MAWVVWVITLVWMLVNYGISIGAYHEQIKTLAEGRWQKAHHEPWIAKHIEKFNNLTILLMVVGFLFSAISRSGIYRGLLMASRKQPRRHTTRTAAKKRARSAAKKAARLVVLKLKKPSGTARKTRSGPPARKMFKTLGPPSANSLPLLPVWFPRRQRKNRHPVARDGADNVHLINFPALLTPTGSRTAGSAWGPHRVIRRAE